MRRLQARFGAADVSALVRQPGWPSSASPPATASGSAAASGERWKEAVVVRRERDGGVGLRDPKGAARAIAVELIEVRTRGPAGRRRLGAARRAGGAHRADEAAVRRRLPAVLAAVAVVALVVLAPAPPAWAKSFGIESVVTNAVVVPDGSMTVSEDVTYDFDGSFNHLTRCFASGTITDLRASEGEHELAVEQTGSPGGLPSQWAIPNTSGRHTYTFSYTRARRDHGPGATSAS